MCESNGCTKLTDGALEICIDKIHEKLIVNNLLRTGAFEGQSIREVLKNPGPVRDSVVSILRTCESSISPGNYKQVQHLYKLVDMISNILYTLGIQTSDMSDRAPTTYYITVSEAIKQIEETEALEEARAIYNIITS